MKQPRLLIERVLTLHRAAAAALQANRDIEWFKAWQCVTALEQAQEFFWKRSGLAMCEVIRAGIDVRADYVLHIDNETRWMFFEEPLPTPCGEIAGLLCYCRTDRGLLAATARACNPSQAALDVLQDLLDHYNGRLNTQWTLYMYDRLGVPSWHIVLSIDEDNHTSWVPDPMFCPDHACCYSKDDVSITVCQRCTQIAAFWIGWLGTALAMLRGEYRSSPELAEPEYITETEVRTERDPKQTWKRTKVKVKHRIRVLHFDAALAPSRNAKKPRGSWTAGRDVGSEEWLDILDDRAIVYTSIDHGAHTRHFRHSRYKAARGTSREFKPTKAFAPVTVRYLKARREQRQQAKKVTVVEAKKFEMFALEEGERC